MDKEWSCKYSIDEALNYNLGKRTFNTNIFSVKFELIRINESVKSFKSVVFHEIDLIGDEFYFLDDFLLISTPAAIKIYKVSSKYKLKLIRTIEICYLLYKYKDFKKSVRKFLYEIFLYLVKNGVSKAEIILEGIICYLKAEDIIKIQRFNGGASLKYKSGEIKHIDNFLDPINHSVDPELMISDKDSKNDNIIIKKDSIRLRKNGSPYFSKWIIPDIKQHQLLENILILLVKDRLLICEFLN